MTTVLLLSVIVFAGAMPKEVYQPKGPSDTAALEIALRERLPVYVEGIWPRTEILDSAPHGRQLPKKAVERLQTWLSRIVRREFLPESMDPNQWYGIRKLHLNHDYIIGQFRKPVEGVTIQFQANGVSLAITAISDSYFPDGVDGIADAEIIEVLTTLVNYPRDMVQSITVEKHVEAMGEAGKKVSVCYGKLWSRGYDPMKPAYYSQPPESELKNVRTWWNFMTFWIVKGKLFFSTTMVNWETRPSTAAPFMFRLDDQEQSKK